MDALPFLPLVKVVRKASTRKTVPPPARIGEHVKCIRSERRLRQADVATEIGVSAATILHWEAGHTEPPVAFMPAITRFLGYEPWPEPRTLGERMLTYRRRNGTSIKEAAARLGADECSWGAWEKTSRIAHPKQRALVDEFLSEREQ